MDGDIEKKLDAMTPGELSALEAELDKRAAESVEAHYRELGAQMARESYAQLKEAGVYSPALFLLKAASEASEAPAAPAADEIDALLDKCSADELAQMEAELDQEKTAAEFASVYTDVGRKLARELWADAGFQKEAAPRIKALGFNQGFLAGTAGKGGTGFGHAIGSMVRKNPGVALATAAVAPVAADRLLSRR